MSKKKVFKLLPLFLSITFVVTSLLTGCSGGKANTDQATTQAAVAETNQGTASESVPETVASAEKVDIPFWVYPFEEWDQAWWKRWVTAYNKEHTNIQTKVSFIPADAWAQKLKAAQASGTAPEIINIGYNAIPAAASQGQLMPMDEYVDPIIFNDLYENVADFVTVKGKHYAYPKLVEPSAALYYRKDLFKEAGLDPEIAPKSWDELLDYAKKLTKKGVYGLGIPVADGEVAWSTWGFQAQTGSMPISDDWSKAAVNSDGYKSLFTFWKSLYDNKVVPKQALSGYADIKALAEGRVAMQMCGSWAIGTLKATYAPVCDKIGIASFPTPDGNIQKVTATLGGWTLAIDGKAKHPKEAADIITWILAGDPDIMVDFFRTTGYSKFSARKSVDEVLSQDEDAKNNVWRKAFVENVVPYAAGEPIYAWDVSMAYATALGRVILKNQPIDQSLQQAEKEINDYIAKNNYAGTNPKLAN